MGKILGLSYVFSPANIVGGRRFQNFLRILNKKTSVHVITTNIEVYKKKSIPINQETSVPSPVIRVPPFTTTGIAEKILWSISAIIAGIKIIRKENIDVIFATGDPWFVVVTGTILSILTNKRFIVDIRDPWSPNPFIKRGKISRITEKMVLWRATEILLTTNNIKQLYCSAFPQYCDKYTVILNGIDSKTFSNTNKTKYTFPWYEKGKIHFLFSGNITPLRKKSLQLFFTSLNYLEKEVLSSIKIIFYTNTPHIIEVLSKDSEADIIINNYIPLQNLLSAIKLSELTLLIDYSKLEIATKLLEYMALRKFTFAIIPSDSSNSQLITKYNAGIICDNTSTPEYIASQMLYIIKNKLYKKEIPCFPEMFSFDSQKDLIYRIFKI